MTVTAGLRRACIVLLILWQPIAAAGCERYAQISVPEQKKDFIGRWSAGPNFFELGPDGEVNLELEASARTFLIRKGSLRYFGAESICVGVGERQEGDCLSISADPYASSGREVIVLEGVELARE